MCMHEATIIRTCLIIGTCSTGTALFTPGVDQALELIKIGFFPEVLGQSVPELGRTVAERADTITGRPYPGNICHISISERIVLVFSFN